MSQWESDPDSGFDIAGLCAGARWVPSPHYDARPEDAKVELVVIHNISLPPGELGGKWIDDLFLGRQDLADEGVFRRPQNQNAGRDDHQQHDGDRSGDGQNPSI